MSTKLSHTSVIKKQSFDYELIAMSYHESGHAVIALYNYIKVLSVNVLTPKTRVGHTEYSVFEVSEIENEELKQILLICELQALYAGLMAEKLYYKDICGSSRFPMHLRIGSANDLQYASKLIRKYNIVKPGKNTSLFKKQLQSEVIDILQEHWDAVKIITHSLYQRNRLSFDEIKYLLTRKTDHKDFWKKRFKDIKFIHDGKEDPPDEIVKNVMSEDLIFSL